MYTVYKHTCPNGKVYIGITSQNANNRWRNGNGYKYNPYFYRAILKYGWDNITHEILFDGLDKSEAEKKEIELIAKHKSNTKESGYNITNGGNCVGTFAEETKEKLRKANLGKRHTEETREKMRISHKGENNYLYGKHLTEETKSKLSKAHFGKKASDETIEKMRERYKHHRHPMLGKKGENHPASKAVKCIETDAVYVSITIASETLKIDGGSITNVCKGKRKTAGGYHWEYIN